MASAVLAGVNEPHWDERNAYMRKYTTSNPTSHSQLHSRFNPNPNPNPSPNFSLSRQVQNGPAASHRRQVNEQLPRAVPSPAAPMANNNAVVDRNDSFHREYVTFNLASYSRSELKDLKKRLISDLGRVRGLLSRIEAQDFVSGASFHAREVIQPPAAPQLQPALPSKPELVGRKNKKLTGQKRPRAMATRKDTKRPVVEGDKFFVSMMRSCRQILIKLMSKKDSYWFNSPVDVKGMNLYDYFDIIKHPMDLGTVKSRLDKKEYRTPQDFAADVRLTFNNAMTYNLKGQRVHTLAEECLGLFEKLFNPAYEKYEEEHRKVAAIMQVKPQKNLPQPALIPTPNALHQQLPVARKSDSVRLQSTLLNQQQFQVPVAPIFATPTPALKSPPHPVITTPSSAKLPKPKAKDPNKRQMTFEEKVKLGADLQDLPLAKLDHALQIVKKKTPNLTQDGNEIELDFELIDNETMWELERFVGYHKKAMSKMRRQGVTEDAAVVQLNKVKKVFGFVICLLTNLYIVPCYLITLLHFVKRSLLRRHQLQNLQCLKTRKWMLWKRMLISVRKSQVKAFLLCRLTRMSHVRVVGQAVLVEDQVLAVILLPVIQIQEVLLGVILMRRIVYSHLLLKQLKKLLQPKPLICLRSRYWCLGNRDQLNRCYGASVCIFSGWFL